jgi:hypothetical protein
MRTATVAVPMVAGTDRLVKISNVFERHRFRQAQGKIVFAIGDWASFDGQLFFVGYFGKGQPPQLMFSGAGCRG